MAIFKQNKLNCTTSHLKSKIIQFDMLVFKLILIIMITEILRNNKNIAKKEQRRLC